MSLVKHKIVVFRRRSNLALRPVHRIKHVVDNQGGLTLGVVKFVNLVITKDAPVLANTDEVETGAKVNGVYLKIEVVRTQATSGVLTNVYLIVFKNPGGNLPAPVPNAIGISDDKRYVIHQEMIMTTQTANENPRILFNGVIVIPRGYRRFGPNDQLQIALLSPGGTMNYCLQCHYKEFR